ncbi:hypothetical protein PISMIDRAFT_674858 [Pisolithus microcarpus 441]|uniref:Uncharacterized protein n=1 Tax=Pisolithus microcarpus 441 TaxID=765257 RepID=A0A0C9ZE11_9AGAM|nr:hypothetical protein PISMIDRAFT_674858 [Pisolithus microcarpus 441]
MCYKENPLHGMGNNKMRSLRTADIDASRRLARVLSVNGRTCAPSSLKLILFFLIPASYRPGEAAETQRNPGTFVG